MNLRKPILILPGRIDKLPQGIQKTTIEKRSLSAKEIEKKCHDFMKDEKISFFKSKRRKDIIVSAVSGNN